MGNLVTIPNAVVGFINAGSFSQSFTATKEYLPTEDISFFTDLKVMIVLPTNKSVNIDARNWVSSMVDVSLLVKKKTSKTDKTAIENMLILCDEIVDYLVAKTITGTKFVCTAVVFNVTPDLEQLEEQNMFTGAFTITYKDLNIT